MIGSAMASGSVPQTSSETEENRASAAFMLPALARRETGVSNFSEKVKEEFLALLPPTIFFFIALHIVALVRALMVHGTGLPVSSSGQIAVGALILGKAVLLADLMPAINRFPDKPLAYNVAWKTAIYFLIATFIHYLERLVDFWKQADGFAAANEKLLAVHRLAALPRHPDRAARPDTQLLHAA